MSLDEYWRKRDFERTPEPRGAEPDPARPLLRRFVVQRHRASRLHYDFRLEVGGVLASWAVPRGPSMQPLAKRRAAHTEDHPLEYAAFEGAIPKGEYGAGDLIVWDHGTWEPELAADPSASIADGELKLILHGERLKGRFVIVRTGAGQKKDDWLLIKKDDRHAQAGWDIDEHLTSVLSGRTNEQIADGRAEGTRPGASTAAIDLASAAPSEMPDFVEPMAATAVENTFDDPGWLFELKLDGYRVQAVARGGQLRLWTRNHKNAAVYFPTFAATPTDWLGPHDAIIDGEMVALDADGRPSFSLLQELTGLRGLGVKRGERTRQRENADRPVGALVYHAFDLLHLDGWDLLRVPLESRKRLLQMTLREHPSVRFVSHVVEEGEAFHAAVVEQGLEGSIAKLRQSRYVPGARSREWLKIKVRREQELVLVGYEPGQGTHAELGSLLVATREAREWRFAGRVGSGLDARTRASLKRLLDDHGLAASPLRDAPELPLAQWSEPRQVIRAEFTEWTADGLLRQAVFRGREVGRDPATVTREMVRPFTPAPKASAQPATATEHTHVPVTASTPSATAGALEALDRLGAGGSWEVDERKVELTNLDKALFPDVGFTKRDLVRYYTTIAPTILPYLRERPLNVHRWPDGVGGEKGGFWQKQIPSHAPEWVTRWHYPEAGRSQSHTYVVADSVATMAWLANQAVIDLHPWTSRLPDYWRPTYAYIDIDPGERTSWEEILVLARLYRTALDHLGVRGYPKVTGQRGIQIWIAVQSRYTFEETRDWVGGLSRGVGAVVPELVSWEWTRADRGGRARLDYTQNSMIKTLVAPYAVRPVASGAVSAPITWDELDDPSLAAQRWDMRSIVARVAERGDVFAGVLSDPQALPPLS